MYNWILENEMKDTIFSIIQRAITIVCVSLMGYFVETDWNDRLFGVADFVDVRSPGPCEYRKKPSGTIRVPSFPTRTIENASLSLDNDNSRHSRIVARLMIRANYYYYKNNCPSASATLAEHDWIQRVAGQYSTQRFRVCWSIKPNLWSFRRRFELARLMRFTSRSLIYIKRRDEWATSGIKSKLSTIWTSIRLIISFDVRSNY